MHALIQKIIWHLAHAKQYLKNKESYDHQPNYSIKEQMTKMNGYKMSEQPWT